MTAKALKLDSRAVLRLSGTETRKFLQGLVTNDVMAAVPGKAVYAALLTPQGKFMYDMIIMRTVMTCCWILRLSARMTCSAASPCINSARMLPSPTRAT